MLTREQNQENEAVLKLLSKLHILPFEFETNFQVHSKKKCGVWYGLITGGMLHTGYRTVQLVISAIENYSALKKGSSGGQLFLHAGLTLASVLIYSNVIMLFLRPHDRDQTSRLVREIYPMGKTDEQENEETATVKIHTENVENSTADASSNDGHIQNQCGSRNELDTNGTESMVVLQTHVHPIRKPREVNEEDRINVFPEKDEIIVLPKEQKEERELLVFQLAPTSKRVVNDSEEEPGPNTGLFKISTHDFLGWAAGPIVYFSAFIGLLGAAFYSDSRQLIFYVLPDNLKSPVTFCLCFCVETISLTFVISHAFFITLIKVLLLQRVDLRLSQIIKALKNRMLNVGLPGTEKREAQNQTKVSTEDLNQVIVDLKKVGILVELYNNHLCWVVYATKTLTTALAIICAYFGIRFLHKDLKTSIIGFQLSVSASVLILLLYDLGLNMQPRMKWANKEILFQGALAGVNARREVCCIRSLGIKVGNFRMLPRNTTPAVIHYIITETAGYVIMFR